MYRNYIQLMGDACRFRYRIHMHMHQEIYAVRPNPTESSLRLQPSHHQAVEAVSHQRGSVVQRRRAPEKMAFRVWMIFYCNYLLCFVFPMAIFFLDIHKHASFFVSLFETPNIEMECVQSPSHGL